MTSISLTSGKPSTPSRRWLEAKDFAGSAAGTSSGGRSNARLPGEDFSKIRPSFWFVCVVAFLILSVMISICSVGARHAVPLRSSMRSNGLLQRFAQRGGEALDFGARRRFRNADERVLCQFGICGSEDKRANDFLAQEIGVYDFYRAWQLNREFVEEWSVESATDAGNFFKFGESELRFGKILVRHFAQPFFAEEGEV